MSQIDMEDKIRELKRYRSMAEELNAMADSIATELKAMMTTLGLDRMQVGEYKLTYTDVRRETLDQKRLEADLGDLSEYKKVTTYKRFNVA